MFSFVLPLNLLFTLREVLQLRMVFRLHFLIQSQIPAEQEKSLVRLCHQALPVADILPSSDKWKNP